MTFAKVIRKIQTHLWPSQNSREGVYNIYIPSIEDELCVVQLQKKIYDHIFDSWLYNYSYIKSKSPLPIGGGAAHFRPANGAYTVPRTPAPW